MAFCWNCGTEVPVDPYRFCQSCGVELVITNPTGRTQRNVGGDVGPIGRGRRHSGVGIVSLVLGLISSAILAGTFAVAAVAVNGGYEETLGLGRAVMGAGTLAVAALALGIAGLTRKSDNKAFPITGTTLSSLVLLVVIALVTIGASLD